MNNTDVDTQREEALIQLQEAIGQQHLPGLDAATEAQQALDAYLATRKP